MISKKIYCALHCDNMSLLRKHKNDIKVRYLYDKCVETNKAERKKFEKLKIRKKDKLLITHKALNHAEVQAVELKDTQSSALTARPLGNPMMW